MDTTPLPAHIEGSVYLLTGPSGCGKTQALRYYTSERDVHTVGEMLDRDRDKALIDRWPIEPAEAVRLLHSVGLSDPVTWARIPAELSQGQTDRLALADALQSHEAVIVADNFTDHLDRATARALAWTAGRAFRASLKTVLVATPHEDIADDLAPDFHTRIDWTADPVTTEFERGYRACSLVYDLTHEQGTFADWAKVRCMHYAAGDPATTHSVHVARHPEFRDPVAVAVMTWPDMTSAARNLATDDRYNPRRSRYATQALNREVLRLARIVVVPELRSCGVARFLIAEAIASTNARYIECQTAMGRYSRFLERCGFQHAPITPSAPEAAMLDCFERLQAPTEACLDPSRLIAWTDTLSVRQTREVRRKVWLHYHHLVLWRRTRAPVPKQIPGPTDERWPQAWEVAAERMQGRPLYYIYGPIDPLTGQRDDCPDPPHPDCAENVRAT